MIQIAISVTLSYHGRTFRFAPRRMRSGESAHIRKYAPVSPLTIDTSLTILAVDTDIYLSASFLFPLLDPTPFLADIDCRTPARTAVSAPSEPSDDKRSFGDREGYEFPRSFRSKEFPSPSTSSLATSATFPSSFVPRRKGHTYVRTYVSR